MSLRMRVVLCVASAVLAVCLVLGYAASVRSQAAAQRAGALERYGGETAQVCVTTAVVARGEVFSERNVATVEWLVDLLPEGAQTDPSQVMGKTAASTMAPNTPVSAIDVESQASALDVPAGTTAVSVPCSAESAVGGALTPGSTVDVYVVSDGAARLLSPGVQVLQTSVGATGGKLAWVTVAVDPSRVEALVAAASLQRLSFALPAEDVARSEGQPVGDAGAGAVGAAADGVGVQAEDTGTGGAPGAQAGGEAPTPAEGLPADGGAAEDGQPAQIEVADGEPVDETAQGWE